MTFIEVRHDPETGTLVGYDTETGETVTLRWGPSVIEKLEDDLNVDGHDLENVGSIGAQVLNTADIENASADEVPKSDGLGDLSMATVDHAELSGVGADDHHARDHATRHEVGGADELTHNSLDIGPDDHHARDHASRHESGGADELTHNNLAIGPNDHHTDPTAGTGLIDEGDNQFGIASGGVTENELGVEPFVYDPGITAWEDGLSNEEIDRIALQSGETLVVGRIEFRQKGGGTSTSASIEVRDVSAASTIGSANLGSTTKDPGSSGTANTVNVRLTNSTGGEIEAAPRVVGYITGV